MIDQMNSDYVKFARAGGLTENEIFTKHILKNAAIPIIHGIPSEILFAMTGAIVTESVYVVPGAGNLLTRAIGKYDNGVIVGVALFYAILSVISLILGDVLMAMVDPRISFSTKDR
jgi:oligopeptide transport system permease protein